MVTTEEPPPLRVVVIGAGYAGTIAANRLVRRCPQAAVTLVNPRDAFVERVRLHEEVAGSGAASTPLRAMLHPRIAARTGSATRIGDGVVELADSGTLPFDAAIVAVGSHTAPQPGTVPIGTWEGACDARAALADLETGAAVAVVGGGLTGIETAAEVAAARPDLRVRLIGTTVAASLSGRGRAGVLRALTRLGVEVVEDTVVAATGGQVRRRHGPPLASDLVLWAIVGAIPELVRDSGLPVRPDGRAVVDPSLRSVGDERVFVVGDCAAVPGARPSCATAEPQGAHAADSLARIARGRSPRPFSMGYTGQAVSLGRRDGVLQLSHRDDRTRRIAITGRPAAVLKERVSRYASFGARTATYAWLPGPRRARS